jgi:hypothetical protein
MPGTKIEMKLQGEKCIAEAPVGDKLAFLKEAAATVYTVILCFIGVSNPETSEQRVAMRVSQGGHDVPTDKLEAWFPRTLANLRNALRELPHIGCLTMTVWLTRSASLPSLSTGSLFDYTSRFPNGSPPRWIDSVLKLNIVLGRRTCMPTAFDAPTSHSHGSPTRSGLLVSIVALPPLLIFGQ